MLLENSFLIINIFFKNIYLLLSVLFLLIYLNHRLDKEFIKKIKRIVKFFLIYLFYLLISMFFYKTGKIIFSYKTIYVTQEGLIISLTKLIKIINLLLISFLITIKFKNGNLKFKSKNRNIQNIENYYSEILEHILENIPFIFELFKKKVKFSHIYKKILIKVYKNL